MLSELQISSMYVSATTALMLRMREQLANYTRKLLSQMVNFLKLLYQLHLQSTLPLSWNDHCTSWSAKVPVSNIAKIQ